jgi:hypothetical protein
LKGHELYDDAPMGFQFNMGAHSCLGKNLAYIELRLILAELLRSFSFDIPAEHREVDFLPVFDCNSRLDQIASAADVALDQWHYSYCNSTPN